MTIDQLPFVQPGGEEALERFVAERVFQNPRAGDGIVGWRIIECSASRVRIVGRMWLIEDQSQQVFFVELISTNENEFRWTISFGLLAIGSSRRPRDLENATILIESADQAEWQSEFSGSQRISD